MENLIKSSEIQNKYTSTGRSSGYMVDLYHKGLDEHKHLSASEYNALSGKIHNQTLQWQARWEKELARKQLQSKEQRAQEETEIALRKIQAVESILEHTLSLNDAINWEALKYFDE